MASNETYDPVTAEAVAHAYDAEAQSTGWLGGEVAFGLAYEYVLPGQSLLDLGIGTGLGSALFRKAGLRVYGMDVSPMMVATCRWKGYEDLTLHDLARPPYPYAAESFDHVVCIAVLNFFSDLSPVFAEVARLIKVGGAFVFTLGTRSEGEPFEVVVGPEFTKTDESVTLYVYTLAQISKLSDSLGFRLARSLPFPMFLDAGRRESMPVECYVARRI